MSGCKKNEEGDSGKWWKDGGKAEEIRGRKQRRIKCYKIHTIIFKACYPVV
jgi:hypothetical protein